jgi:hypothetical protein
MTTVVDTDTTVDAAMGSVSVTSQPTQPHPGINIEDRDIDEDRHCVCKIFKNHGGHKMTPKTPILRLWP